jgi:hypothetical protein
MINLKVLNMCQHPEHNPPGLLYVPAGMIFIHMCPGCKREQRVISPYATLEFREKND